MGLTQRIRAAFPDLAWEADPENPGGMVAEVPAAEASALEAKAKALFTEVSRSEDRDEGRAWLWIAA